MGRRSISTTKSGKFMNPTDQARKEARKKELKKNKKQRQMVRAAVLKGKDPKHLIEEMEKIDRMEYDVNNPPQLNEKVLQDKRKKLKDTFIRVLKLYEKEDPEQWRELRKLENQYKARRNMLVQFFESVKHAQQVQVEDIPLPAVQMPGSMMPAQIPLPSDIPLPGIQHKQPPPPPPPPQPILKKSVNFEPRDYLDSGHWSKYKEQPGVPPGLPPPLSDGEDNDDGTPTKTSGQSQSSTVAEKPRKIRFADEGPPAVGDGKVTEQPAAVKLTPRIDTAPSLVSLAPGPLPPGLPPGPPPGLPPLMFRPPPPPLRPGVPPPVRLPPGPPPGRPPGHHPPGLPPRMMGMSGPPVRLPPGPPPGIPPSRLMRPPSMGMMPSMTQSSMNPNVLSAPPSLISRPKMDDDHKGSATIEAKPQIRNLSADVMRFMPTSLRVKREEKGRRRDQKSDGRPFGSKMEDPLLINKVTPMAAPMKDDAYEQFMKEMEDLL